MIKVFPKSFSILAYSVLFCTLILLFGARTSEAQTVPDGLRINEFMASNASTLVDEDADFSDWIELYNPTSASIQLEGWALTDDVDEPFKWRFTGGSILPNAYTVVFASGKDRQAAALAWETVIDQGDTWRYFVGTSAPPENWLSPDFDETTWAEGASGFGYGDDDDATVVDPTLSVYVRRTFDVASGAEIARALLDIDYDDGFVAYLNGVEIARANIGTPGIRPAFDEGADSVGEPFLAFDQPPARFEIDNLADLLLNGENLLAIEVHNASLESSDLTLIPFLTLGYATPPDQPGEVADEIRTLPGGESHTNFQLSKDGEYLALTQPDGTLITSFGEAYPLQSEDLSFGVEAEMVGYHSSPTPGMSNSPLITGFVERPVFSVSHGFFNDPFSVTLKSATPNAVVRYTLDGSEPTLTSGRGYDAPILIEGTTTLRAAAFKSGYVDSPSNTQTYLFLEDIVRQSLGGSPPAGWPRVWGNNVVDYGMDVQIVGLPGTSARSEVMEALQTLPSISLVADLDDLFDTETGIYANASARGQAWERPTSAELIFPDGEEGFQINAGLRIRGGFSRSDNNPKHAFRLFFRNQKLQYPLFGEEGVDEFENIDLRTSQNYSWSFNGDSRNTMNRDVFSRDIQRDMELPYTRSRYYHLYLNGQYWGLFQSQERSEAAYGESYFGGNKDDFDVMKSTGPTEGFYDLEATDGNTDAWLSLWNLSNELASATDDDTREAIYQQILGKNPDGARNEAFPVLLDADNLINYMLIIFYTGNFDAPISWFLGNEQINNFYAMIDRTADEGFRFFAHDSEHTLLPGTSQSRDRTGPLPAGSTFRESNPQWIHQQLLSSTEYRMRFADLAQQHLRNDGALTPAVSRERFNARAAELEQAILAESARWGDSKREEPLTITDWTNAVNNISDNFFAGRSEEIIGILTRTRKYEDWQNPNRVTIPWLSFPVIDPPTFSQNGGSVAGGFALDLTSDADSVFYTLDGRDPRLPGGMIAPFANRSDGASITLAGKADVKTRAIKDGAWSALNQATFYVDSAAPESRTLVISEIHYNPSAPTAAEIDAGFDNNDDFEFVELYNAGDVAMNLAGLSFTDGIAFTFGPEVLAPEGYVLVVRNAAAFAFRYGSDKPVAGEYGGRLSNNGEKLEIRRSAAGAVVHAFTYETGGSWPSRPDGSGSSLELINTISTEAIDYNMSVQWNASTSFDGSPGTSDNAIASIVINEVLTHTDLPQVDTIELLNTTSTDIDMSGWFLSDSNEYRKFVMPAGTIIPAGGYLLFDETDFNTEGDPAAFALDSARGDAVWLLEADAAGNLIRFVDQVSFGATENGTTLGRWPNGLGELYPMGAPSLGSSNSEPQIGSVVIREIMYNPPNNDRYLEYIELYNNSADDTALDRWQIGDGVSFEFPAGTVLPAGEAVKIVPFDPLAEPDKVDAFDGVFDSAFNTPLLGPWSGRLNNAGEQIVLTRADEPPADAPDLFPQIEVDRVRYASESPWPTEAIGEGAALVRVNVAGLGNDPENWVTESRLMQSEPPVGPVDTFELSDPFPNPAAEFATITLVLETQQFVRVALYDVLGREVRSIEEASLEAAQRHQYLIEADGLAGGVYFIHVVGEMFSATRSVVVVR
ncbi:MAG: lamin tail domain-containing protein [Rhodothermales bacterium]